LDQNPEVCEVVAFDYQKDQVETQRIYDQNAILLMHDSQQNNKVLTIQQTLDEMYLMENVEEEMVRKEMTEKNHTVSIKFQVEGEGNTLECIPVSVEPAFVSLSEYTIDFNPSQRCIGKVSNNQLGPVKFESFEIDANAGYVPSAPIDLWTTILPNGVFNIFHCHLVDQNDTVPIDLVYMQDTTKAEDFHEFGTDSTGQVLRYKILIQNQAVHKILYNTGSSIEEIQFIENRVVSNSLMQAVILEQVEDIPIIVQIIKIPNSMTCAKNPKDLSLIEEQKVDNYPLIQCRMRYFERIPGLVDVQVISDKGLSQEGGELATIIY